MKFSDLKKSNTLDSLIKEVEKQSKPAFEKDESEDSYWKPTPDKSGNALAVIRFLPGAAVDGEGALPWVQYWDHGFQSKVTGKYYIEKSLTTLGKDVKDPVSEYNSMLWNSNSDNDSPERKQARDQKRRLHYVSNIYVVSDPQNKDAEGKVFRYRYGKKIFDKITKMMNPDLESEPRVNPFHLYKGANFKLKMTRQTVNIGGRQVNFPNYDESVFLAPGPFLEDDDALEAIWKAQHSLKEIIDPKNFKSYEQLKARLDDVLGLTSSNAYKKPAAKPVEEDEDDVPFADSKPIAKKAAPKKVEVDDDDDEDLKMFKNLGLMDDED